MMGRNEIRLKRQKLSSGRIAKHRNYDELMARHEREKKIKRATYALVYFAIFAILMVLLLAVLTIRKLENQKAKEKKAVYAENTMHYKS